MVDAKFQGGFVSAAPRCVSPAAFASARPFADATGSIAFRFFSRAVPTDASRKTASSPTRDDTRD